MTTFSHKFALVFLFFLGTVFAILFLLWPEIDIQISAYFYRNPGGFYLEFDPSVRGVYLFVSAVTKLLVVSFLLVFAAQIFSYMTKSSVGEKLFKKITPAVMMYLAVALILGPGIGVNYMLKEGFERPRPREIIEFGGSKQFMPALAVGKENGNSFVSGHAAMGFYLAAFALLARGWWRIALYGFAVLAGGFIGSIRVMQGGHFASDIVFSGIFTLMVVHACYAIFYTRINHARLS